MFGEIGMMKFLVGWLVDVILIMAYHESYL